MLFKTACRLGVLFGIIQAAIFLLMFGLCFFSPGGPPSPILAFALVAAIIAALSASLVLKHRKGTRGIFTVATVCVSFFYLVVGNFIFGVINLIPLLLLVASSSPDAAPAKTTGGESRTENPAATENTAQPEGDLY